jgi:hypothetical protein
MTTHKPDPYPLLCRSLYCGETDLGSDWCRNCSNRPALDAYYRRQGARQAIESWDKAYAAAPAPEHDHTGGSHPYNSPALAGWGGGDR